MYGQCYSNPRILLIFTAFLPEHSGIQAVRQKRSSSGINWATIIFVAGMMVIVEGVGVGFSDGSA